MTENNDDFVETKFCSECGAPIDLHFVRPTKVFAIKDGEIVRYDNNPVDQHMEYHCSNNIEHDIKADAKLLKWCDEVEDIFFEEEKDDD